MGSLFTNIIFGLLGNAQFQSLLRSSLKIGATALIVKGGGDTGSVDTILGGVFGVIGLIQSFITHSPTIAAKASPTPAAA